MARSSRALALAAALLLACTVASEEARADDLDVQHWHNLFAQGRMLTPGTQASPALWYLEVQPRASLLGGQVERVLLRGAVGLDVGALLPGLTLWAGAAGIPEYRAPHWSVGETRLWQQAMFVDNIPLGDAGALQLVIRGRLEERAFERTAAGAEDPSVRVRAMLRAVYTLPVGERDWALVAFDEGFVGLLGADRRLGFDQNRAFVGVLKRLAPWFSVEGGYLHVQIGVPGSDNARQLHTLLVQTTANLL